MPACLPTVRKLKIELEIVNPKRISCLVYDENVIIELEKRKNGEQICVEIELKIEAKNQFSSTAQESD